METKGKAKDHDFHGEQMSVLKACETVDKFTDMYRCVRNVRNWMARCDMTLEQAVDKVIERMEEAEKDIK